MIRAGWWPERNFGDRLTRELLRRWNVDHVFAPVSELPDFVGIGSILQEIPSGYEGMIVGTGAIRPERIHLEKADVRLVRGSLSSLLLGRADVPLGDPGLLVDELLPHRPEADLELGWFPHYADKRDNIGEIFDVTEEPLVVLRNIARCEKLTTSSLHVLIAADTLGIPHLWEPSPAVIGGGFKFEDYGSAVGEEVRPHEWRLTSRSRLDPVRARVRTVMLEAIEDLEQIKPPFVRRSA